VKVAIVGAGLAGLAAARTLKKAGWDVRVFEKGSAVGGRCASESLDGFLFDTGATNIAPRGRELEPVMLKELDTSDLVKITKPVWVHAGLRVSAGPSSVNSMERYAYRGGNIRLPLLLAEGLDVCLDTPIEGIERNNGEFKVANDQFDAVILTVPAPEAHELLQGMGINRPLGQCRYRPCMAVSLAYRQDIGDLPYFALLEPEQRHPLVWLSVESIKCPDRAPEGCTGFMAQLGPQFSAEHFESDEGSVIGHTVEYVERLYGSEWSSPALVDLVRWRYSQPENVAMFDSVNQPGSKVLVAGDGVVGGRTEYAYTSGVKAANMLLEAYA